MKFQKHITKGERLRTTKASNLTISSPSEHQIKLWDSYKDRAEETLSFEKNNGEIWSTLSKPRYPERVKAKNTSPRLVLILDSEGEVLFYQGMNYHKILVAPISTNIEMATEWDFVVQTDQSPLGYPFMIELWNKVTMLGENLNRGLGKLDGGYVDHVLRLRNAEAASLVDDSSPDSNMFRNNIGEGKVEIGNEIFHFQRREVEEVEYLVRPIKILTELLSKENAKKETVFDAIQKRVENSVDVNIEEVLTDEDKKRGISRVNDNFQDWYATA